MKHLKFQFDWDFLLGLGLFYTLLFVAMRSASYIGGDEVFLVSDLGASYDRSPWELGYFRAVQERFFLVHSLRGIYQFFGEDLRATLFFFQLCFVGSCLLLFLTLRRFFSKAASSLVSLFYLCYVGKFEILSRFDGGFYHVVLLLLSLAVYVYFWKAFSYRLRLVIVAILIWFSLHFYELLMAVAPFFPLLYFLERKARREKLELIDVFCSFLPLLLCLGHLCLIASAENPIWNRNETFQLGPFARIAFAIKVFFMSLSSLFGPKFVQWNMSGLYSFLRVELLSRPYLLFLLFACFAWLLSVCRVRRDQPLETARSKVIAVWALVLVLLTPMISLPVAQGFVPSRFTYVSSFMACFPLAFAMDWFSGRKRSILLSGLAMFVMLQAMALSGINAQHRWAGELDEKIERALSSLNLQLQDGEALFVSMPFDSREKHFRKNTMISGQYVDKDWGETFWGHQTHLAKAPVYQAHIRREAWAWKSFLDFASKWRERNPVARAHFVYLDAFYRPWNVIKVQYFENERLVWSSGEGDSIAFGQKAIEEVQGPFKMKIFLEAPNLELQPQPSLYQ